MKVIKNMRGNTGFMSGKYICNTFTSVVLFLYYSEGC